MAFIKIVIGKIVLSVSVSAAHALNMAARCGIDLEHRFNYILHGVRRAGSLMKTNSFSGVLKIDRFS